MATIAEALRLALALAAFAIIAVLAVHRQIRRSLAAPRVAESHPPDALPWCEVAIPAAQGAPALAIIHGWGGNAEMMLPLARPLHTAGYTLLFFDARKHSGSDGDSFASLPRFAEDLERAVDCLRSRPEVDVRRIGVIGHSVGAGAALLLASRRSDLTAVVTLAAFADPETMMGAGRKPDEFPTGRWEPTLSTMCNASSAIASRTCRLVTAFARSTARYCWCTVPAMIRCRSATHWKSTAGGVTIGCACR